MGIKESGQQGLTSAIDYLCARVSEFFYCVISCNSQYFSIFYGNQPAISGFRAEWNDVYVKQNKVRH